MQKTHFESVSSLYILLSYSVVPREKMEQTSNALKEKMMSKVDELTDQLKDLKDLLKKIDTTMAEKHVDTHMEEITVDLIN